jgi:hypothetical protein
MKHKHKSQFSWAAFALVLSAAVLVGARGYLVNDEVALHAAQVSGYTDVAVTGRHNIWPGLFGCSGHDAVGINVTATNPQGQRVDLLVCSGWLFKSATVRIP